MVKGKQAIISDSANVTAAAYEPRYGANDTDGEFRRMSS